MNKNRILGASAGRAGNLSRSPHPSKVRSVDPATVHRRRLSLPQEIGSVSLRRLRLSKGILTAEQKSAEGIVGHDVGKASEELRMPKGGAMDRPSRERWPKARRIFPSSTHLRWITNDFRSLTVQQPSTTKHGRT